MTLWLIYSNDRKKGGQAGRSHRHWLDFKWSFCLFRCDLCVSGEEREENDRMLDGYQDELLFREVRSSGCNVTFLWRDIRKA